VREGDTVVVQGPGHTRGRGADVVFDVASAVQTVPLAIELARFRGRVLLAGLDHFQPIPNLVTDQIVLRGLSVSGGQGMTPQSVAKAVALIEAGRVRTDLVVGEVFRLEEIASGRSRSSRVRTPRGTRCAWGSLLKPGAEPADQEVRVRAGRIRSGGRIARRSSRCAAISSSMCIRKLVRPSMTAPTTSSDESIARDQCIST